jgi:mRNA interferase MazF
MKARLAPGRADVVWLGPQHRGPEEPGNARAGVIITPKLYNHKSGLAILCPITPRAKGYPFEVKLPPQCEVKGVILADQPRSVDWEAAGAQYVCTLDSETMQELLAKLGTLIR